MHYLVVFLVDYQITAGLHIQFTADKPSASIQSDHEIPINSIALSKKHIGKVRQNVGCTTGGKNTLFITRHQLLVVRAARYGLLSDFKKGRPPVHLMLGKPRNIIIIFPDDSVAEMLTRYALLI